MARTRRVGVPGGAFQHQLPLVSECCGRESFQTAAVSERAKLEGLVLGARDDLVLQGAGQVTEVVAVTGNAHDQVAVFFSGSACAARRVAAVTTLNWM